jgi:uncharacterized membrane protein HdeD (DUF308 family)
MVATVNSSEGLRGPATVIKKGGGWSIAVALVFIILGTTPIVEPGLASLAVTILVGCPLVFCGAAHFIAAFISGGGTGRLIWQAIVGIAYVIAGVYFLTHPIAGLGMLSLLLVGIILVETALQFIAHFWTRNEGAWWLRWTD